MQNAPQTQNIIERVIVNIYVQVFLPKSRWEKHTLPVNPWKNVHTYTITDKFVIHPTSPIGVVWTQGKRSGYKVNSLAETWKPLSKEHT